MRQNILFGAKVIKICVDCKPYGYTADEIRLFIARSREGRAEGRGPRADARLARRNAIDGGHLVDRALGSALDDELHKLMAQKGIWRAGTETPMGIAGHPVSQQVYRPDDRRPEERLREQGAADVFDRRGLLRRRQDARRVVPRVPEAVAGRRHPNADIIRAITINGYQVGRYRQGARADQGRLLRRPHRRPGQSAGRRGAR